VLLQVQHQGQQQYQTVKAKMVENGSAAATVCQQKPLQMQWFQQQQQITWV
jgi:hypothetical protein